MEKKFLYFVIGSVLLLVGIGIGLFVIPRDTPMDTDRVSRPTVEDGLEDEADEIREIEVTQSNDIDNSNTEDKVEEGSLVLKSKYQEGSKYFIEGYEVVPYEESYCSKEGAYCEGIPELKEIVSKFELAEDATILVDQCFESETYDLSLSSEEFDEFDLSRLCVGGHIANLFSYKTNEKGEVVFMEFGMI
jgi:hypothetical protein